MFILKNNPSLRRMSQIRRNFGATCTLKGIAVRRSLSVRSCFGAWCTNSYTSEKTTSNGEFIRTDTRATKFLAEAHYTQAHGRSMVEMLGVLAIIGVLSVGAIAGYSKAMSKYKLNKHMESFNILLNEAIKLLPELQRTYGKNTNSGHSLGSFFHKANLLPDGMTYNQQDDFIYDIFKNKTDITYMRSTNTDDSGNVTGHPTIYFMNIYMNRSGTKISNLDNEICRNVFLACKENAENIYSVEMRSLKTGSYVAPSLSDNRLRNATLKQIDDVCSSCDSEIGCYIILYISVVYE